MNNQAPWTIWDDRAEKAKCSMNTWMAEKERHRRKVYERAWVNLWLNGVLVFMVFVMLFALIVGLTATTASGDSWIQVNVNSSVVNQ